MDANGIPSETEKLTTEAERLARIVKELHDSSKHHWENIVNLNKKNRRLIIVVTIGLVLDIMLSVFLLIGFGKVNDNETSINQVNSRISTNQTTTRSKVLCPLYKILISLNNPLSASKYPGGAAAYNAIFTQLENSYNALDCGS